MKIALCASEAFPFAKTGGLGDVVGSLATYFLRSQDVSSVVLFLPKYRDIGKTAFSPKKISGSYLVPVADRIEKINIYHVKWGKVDVYLVDVPKYFDRPGLYRSESGEFLDNDERFIVFQRAFLEGLKFIDFKPDIISAHDWQCGLVPAYLKTLYLMDSFFARTKSVFTLHNVAYQGMFGKETFIKAGFSWFDFTPDKLEYYGGINFMKAGIVYADLITTVSPTYAKEICENSQIARGLEGVLNFRKDKLVGILNGIDTEVWDPATDTFIYRGYDVRNVLRNKPFCKKSFQKEFNLEERKDKILCGCVSRLDWQKGIDLIADFCEEFFDKMQFAILGSGDKEISNRLKQIAKNNPKNFVFFDEFSEELAHKIYAASDVFLMPSRFEPCGLSQMIASRYGSVCVVTETGGLKDTIFYYPDELIKSNGFTIPSPTVSNLRSILGHIISVYSSKEIWSNIIRNAMKSDFSWTKSVKEYIENFKKLISEI